jgi:retron-type reverse transcriptase
MKPFDASYHTLVTVEKLLQAWQEFLPGKRKRKDVAAFQVRLLDNIFDLYNSLISKTYVHQKYQAFAIADPKPRSIHKATVRDRLLHHLLYQELYPYFDQKFIYDSYSCRLGKGTHKAIYRFAEMGRRVSRNNSRTCYILKCDIRKFFANIDHRILKNILSQHISDQGILWLLSRVIDSFHTEGTGGVGLPLGNLTSQLLVNVYMNEFDQFVKRVLKVKYYIRYADDFVIFNESKALLQGVLLEISDFLNYHLKLSLHPDKVFIQTLSSGVDFLGWVHFPDHRVLRTSTKKRMHKRLKEHGTQPTIQSYLGMLKHGNTFKLQKNIVSPTTPESIL